MGTLSPRHLVGESRRGQTQQKAQHEARSSWVHFLGPPDSIAQGEPGSPGQCVQKGAQKQVSQPTSERALGIPSNKLRLQMGAGQTREAVWKASDESNMWVPYRKLRPWFRVSSGFHQIKLET